MLTAQTLGRAVVGLSRIPVYKGQAGSSSQLQPSGSRRSSDELAFRARVPAEALEATCCRPAQPRPCACTQASSRRGVQGAGLRVRTSHGPCRCGFTFAGDRRPGSPYQRIARGWRLNTGEPCRLQGHDTGDLHLPGFASAERRPPSCEAPRHLLNDSGEPVPADGRAAAARGVQVAPSGRCPRARGRSSPLQIPVCRFQVGQSPRLPLHVRILCT